jgi:tRNA nucleotidyltransferase (CCA-adding enzyme)
VNAGEIAGRYVENKERIPEAIHAARVAAVKAALGDVRD